MRHTAPDIDPASESDRAVATDGAVGEHRRALTADADTATRAVGLDSRLVAADGAIDERQHPPPAPDAAAAATRTAGRPVLDSAVVADGTADIQRIVLVREFIGKDYLNYA